MKRIFLGLLLALALAAAGCGAGGAPTAVAPETSYDFGPVPMSNDPAATRYKEFVIKNEGTGDLKLSGVDVKLLKGC